MSSQIIYYSLHCKTEETIKLYNNFTALAAGATPMPLPVSLDGISQNNFGVSLIFAIPMNGKKSSHHYNMDLVKHLSAISQQLHHYFPSFHAPPLDGEIQMANKFLERNNLQRFVPFKEKHHVSTQDSYKLLENTLDIVGAEK